MTKNQATSMVISLGQRAQQLDHMLENGSISLERYTTERTAIDVVVSFVSTEIGYEPYKYLRYSDIIAAYEMAKAKEKVIQRLETEYRNKAEAESKAKGLIDAFAAGIKSAGLSASLKAM